MLIEAAEKHFGNRADIARALGESRTASAVYQWRDAVPLAAARKLAILSNGELAIDESLYDDKGRVKHKPVKRQRARAA